MNISKYTRLIEDKEKYYLYNSLSNYFATINEDLFLFLQKKQESSETLSIEEMDSVLFQLLKEKKVITNKEQDDYLSIRSSIEYQRRTHNVLLLTITPTMDCNFYCSYCFEEKQKGIMDKKVINRILNFINKQSHIQILHITWFGGEPLLAPKVIEKITSELLKKEIAFDADIITNGYFLTKKNIELLQRCKVKMIQVSIDGMADTHNKKKYTKTDKNTFETILENIDTFVSMENRMTMNIRVNVDKDNKNEFLEVLNFFRNRYSDAGNIHVVPGIIINTTKDNANNSDLLDANKDRYSLYEEDAIAAGRLDFIYPSNIISECAVRNLNTWAFDAKGNVYKCWEIIGNKEYQVGVLTDDDIEITNPDIYYRYLFGADPFEDSECQNCYSLPLCRGGCPHKRIENKFNNKNFNYCTYFKDSLDDYLILRSKFIPKQS